MIRRFAIRILMLILLGLTIQVLTSIYWVSVPKYGEQLFMIGQAGGEMIYFFTFRACFRFLNFNEGMYVMEGVIGLILIDIATIIWFDPYQISVPKYIGFVFAVVIICSRLTIFKNETSNP